MLHDVIDSLIAEAMKEKNGDRVNTFRLIKSELVKKSKEGKELNEALEASVLMKMVAQREDSINQFKAANRMDLVEHEQKELDIIKEFAPKQASDEEIKYAVFKIISEENVRPELKNTKIFMTKVKEQYPSANGKVITDAIKMFGECEARGEIYTYVNPNA